MKIKSRTLRAINFIVSSSAGAINSIRNIVSDASYGLEADTIHEDLIRRIEQRNKDTEYSKSKLKQKYKYADACILGGLTAYEMKHSVGVPQDIQTAYQLAYPDLSSNTSFLDAWASFNDYEQRLGFVNGVKGKLFEVKYVDHINATLEDGYVAELASSSTQSGWDIKVTGPDQEYVELIQLKATQSLSYVENAIQKYPEIDVVTLEDFEGQLSQISGNITASNISNTELTSEINEAINSNEGLIFPGSIPLLGIAFLAYQSYSKDSLDAFKDFQFGERTGNYLVNYGIIFITNPYIGIPLVFIKEGYLNDSRKKRELNEFLADHLEKSEKSQAFWEKNVTRRDFLKGLVVAGGVLSARKSKI